LRGIPLFARDDTFYHIILNKIKQNQNIPCFISPKTTYKYHSKLDLKIQKRWFKLDPQSSWGWQKRI